MTKRPSHYKSCYFGGLHPVLEIHYTLKDAKDFIQFQRDMRDGIAAYETSSRNTLRCAIAQDKQDGAIVGVTITKQGKSALNGADVKSLSHALAATGALKADDRLLLQNYIDGTATQPPAPTPAAATGKAGVPAAGIAPAAGPGTILTGSVTHRGYPSGGSAPKPAGKPSTKTAGTTLSVPYLQCVPLFTNGMLSLDYHFAGGMSDPNVQYCESQLRGIVPTAVQQANQILSSPIHGSVFGPYRVDSATSSVRVRFDRGPSHVMAPLQIHELMSIADRLQANGALQAADHAAVIGASGPAAPAAPQANAQSVIVPANAHGVLGYTNFSCSMANGVLCLEYDLPGSILQGPVNAQIARLTNAITQVNQKISSSGVMGSVIPANSVNNYTITRVGIRFACNSANKQMLSQRDIADIANELKTLSMLQPSDHSQLLRVLSNSSFAARIAAGRAAAGAGQAAGATPGNP